MQSPIMSEEAAIVLHQTRKVYKLQHSSQQRPTLGRLFGFGKKGKQPTEPAREFVALDNISLTVAKGERIGLVGRNGAGKTTLLKLLCGNFTPTSGTVKVNGSVQALMTMGTGFHPDHSGRRNAEMALKYNGLSPDDQATAMRDVEEFCELGEFFDQPFKVYSMGMQARLMFAVATAVNPEILVVDEVLGAGDAYFIAKSKLRVERLVKSGCTMILVSHSMPQILELCSRVVWLDQGIVRMSGEAFAVVKAYEEYMHGPINSVVLGGAQSESLGNPTVTDTETPTPQPAQKTSVSDAILHQEPGFLRLEGKSELPGLSSVDPNEFRFLAQGGISRWNSESGVKICGFTIVTNRGETNELVTFQPAAFVLTLMAEESGKYDLRYGVAINDYLGNCITRIFSPRDSFEIRAGELRQVHMMLNPNQIGSGEYVVGLSVLEYGPLEVLNSTRRFDLLSRSFAIRVVLPESLSALESQVLLSGEWQFMPVRPIEEVS